MGKGDGKKGAARCAAALSPALTAPHLCCSFLPTHRLAKGLSPPEELWTLHPGYDGAVALLPSSVPLLILPRTGMAWLARLPVGWGCGHRPNDQLLQIYYGMASTRPHGGKPRQPRRPSQGCVDVRPPRSHRCGAERGGAVQGLYYAYNLHSHHTHRINQHLTVIYTVWQEVLII